MALPIPASHRDLLDGQVVVGLITVMPDGQPQATPVWVDYDGTYVRINTAWSSKRQEYETRRESHHLGD